MLIGFRQAGVAITSVSVDKPTLDEVFFAITGHGAARRRSEPRRTGAPSRATRPFWRSSEHHDRGPGARRPRPAAQSSTRPPRWPAPARASAIIETISQTLVMAWRALKKMRRNPEQFFDVTLQPLLFTAMFAYIFGGAISGNVHSYLPLLIPGIVAQTVLTTCMSTGVQLREDMEKGVFDRFKALPIARIAPLAGPMVADLVRYLIAAGLTFVTGVIIGYRPGGGVLGVLGAIVLAIFTGWALAWIFTCIGTIATQRPGRAGDVVADPVPADLPVQRVRAGQHPAGLAAGLREGQPGLAPGVGHPRPGQPGHRHQRGGLDAAGGPGRDRDLRAALGAQLPAAPVAYAEPRDQPLHRQPGLVQQVRRRRGPGTRPAAGRAGRALLPRPGRRSAPSVNVGIVRL